jgi:UDP-glucose 4-epimerase
VIAIALGCSRDRRAVQAWGDGSIVRDYLFIDDLPIAFLVALEARPGGPHLFNLGVGSGRSPPEVLEACRQVKGESLRLEGLAGRPIPQDVLDCSRARAHLGWMPSVTFMDGFEGTWRRVRNSGYSV